MFAASKDAEAHRRVFDEIVELLLSAGYFRARIAALSDFDKVVGGLCWAITGSGVGVDVDLFFQENSTIGQRIKLSENIVKALRSMRCPYPLQAHQIQGSDFPALFPVIRWLVKSVIETREATGDLVRLFSELQFGKDCISGRPEDDDVAVEADASFLSRVLDRYRPRRKFRCDADLLNSLSSEEERVHSCLLEYGDRVSSRSADDDKAASERRGSATEKTSHALLASRSSMLPRKRKPGRKKRRGASVLRICRRP